MLLSNLWSLEISVSAAKGESIEEVDDVEKEIVVYKKKFVSVPDTLKKSDKLIVDLYDRCFEDLLSTIKEKLAQYFSELFNEYILRETVNNKVYIKKIASYIHIQKEKFKEQVETLTPTVNEISSFGIELHLIHFKKGNGKTFNVNSNLLIIFEPNKYKIKCGNDVIKEKLYSQELNEEERKEVINTCLRYTFEKIKQLEIQLK